MVAVSGAGKGSLVHLRYNHPRTDKFEKAKRHNTIQSKQKSELNRKKLKMAFTAFELDTS